MNKKITIVTFAILMLLSFSTTSFAKKLEKDEERKTQASKVIKKEQSSSKTSAVVKNNTSKTDVETKTIPTTPKSSTHNY